MTNEPIDVVEELWGRWEIPDDVLPEVFQDLFKFTNANPETGVRVWWEKCEECRGSGVTNYVPQGKCLTCNGTGGTYMAEKPTVREQTTGAEEGGRMSGSWEEAALDAERRIMDALEKVSQETGKHFEDIGPAVSWLIDCVKSSAYRREFQHLWIGR